MSVIFDRHGPFPYFQFAFKADNHVSCLGIVGVLDKLNYSDDFTAYQLLTERTHDSGSGS